MSDGSNENGGSGTRGDSSLDPWVDPNAGGSPPMAGYGFQGAGTGESEFGLFSYLQVLYRRRYIAGTAFIAVVLIVTLSTFTAPRIYEASARILIERDTPNVVGFQQVVEQRNEFDDYYETQYNILQSRGLARRTVESLDLWSHTHFNQPPRVTVRSILMMPVDKVISWLEPSPAVRPPDADEASAQSDETSAQSGVIDQFLGDMTVEPLRYSRLVDVKFRSQDPDLTARVANAIADGYMRQTVELRSSTTKEASDFLGQQLTEQRAKLEASEQALQAYRENTDSVSLEERQNVVVQRLADLNAAVTRANTTRIQKEAAYNQVRAAQDNPAAIDSIPLISSNAFVQQQKTELANLQRQRAQLSEKLGPNHPDMTKIAAAIESAQARIGTEVAQIVQGMRNEYETALAEERSLTTSLNRQKQEAQELNRAGIQYGVLQRDAAANKQMFEALMQRTQETGVSEELKSGNIRIVDLAEVPGAPISPNVFNSLVMALLGGFALAVGLAFAMEYVDDRIKNPDELKKHLGMPFLGMVPALFDKTPTTLISDGGPALFGESFRSIRTNVLFSSTERGGRMVVITSSAPGEGKTVVSTNLSVALAQAGHRVLLIDADMRKPRVHDVFGRPLNPGLSNLLVNESKASEVVFETATTGLWVIPAGDYPPNPAELLQSKRFKEFIALVKQHFDWVIVDTPPVMAVTDAAIAANMAQGVVFVVGAEMTSRRVAQRAVEQLAIVQARFLGAVLNRVDLEHNGYYYSKYYRPEYGGYYGPSGGATSSVGGNAGAQGSSPAA